MAKSLLQGKPLKRFVADRAQALRECRELSDDVRDDAIRILQSIERLGLWNVNREDYPSLPGLPSFSIRPHGATYSNIPIPAEHRKDGKLQHMRRWPGQGAKAWGHYLVQVADDVARLAHPPRHSQQGERSSDHDALDELKGQQDADMATVQDVLFDSPIIMGTLGSPDARDSLKSEFTKFLGYLRAHHRGQVKQIDRATLTGFRIDCSKMVARGKVSIRTANGYLSAARRVIRWCIDFLELDLCPAYQSVLRNLSTKEFRSVPSRTRVTGVADTIAMPVEAFRAWIKTTIADPFEWALTMCSLNLAVGAKDLSNLQFLETTGLNPEPVVDMKRRLFVTSRGKTGAPRYTQITDRNELAVPMMKQTYEALTRWLVHREKLVKELTGRTALVLRIQKAKEARRLRDRGFSEQQIGIELGVAEGTVNSILHSPANLKEYARKLASSGYSIDEIVDLTGLSRGSVFNYTQGLRLDPDRKPRPNRYIIVQPDPNRLFFVPTTGRPLADGNSDYVRTTFNRICKRAGILREIDFLPKKGKPKPAPPPLGAFILPKQSGHYIFRRTAATVAGMLGGVPESTLQHFMGHKSPDMTRRYVLHPPGDYNGVRMTHHYTFRLKKSDDPIEVLEAFLDHVMS